MRDFTKLSPRIWHQRSFQALTPRERLQYLYFFGGPHQTSAGCFYVSPQHACSDLGYKMAEYLTTNTKLASLQLIRYDAETYEVLIEDWFGFNPPMNDKHRIGTMKLIFEIRSSELRTVANEALDTAWDQIQARLSMRIRREARSRQ